MIISGSHSFVDLSPCCLRRQGSVMINENSAKLVERHLTFKEGVAYGIDQLLEPPGLGAFCDMAMNKTTYVSPAADCPVILTLQNPCAVVKFTDIIGGI